MTIALRVAEAWAIAAALQLVLWLVQQRTRNAGIVDVGWAGSFTLVLGLFAWRATSPLEVWLPLALVGVLWSVRLTVHLVARGAARSPEEGRHHVDVCAPSSSADGIARRNPSGAGHVVAMARCESCGSLETSRRCRS